MVARRGGGRGGDFEGHQGTFGNRHCYFCESETTTQRRFESSDRTGVMADATDQADTTDGCEMSDEEAAQWYALGEQIVATGMISPGSEPDENAAIYPAPASTDAATCGKFLQRCVAGLGDGSGEASRAELFRAARSS